MDITLYFNDGNRRYLEDIDVFTIDRNIGYLKATSGDALKYTTHEYPLKQINCIHLGRLDNERTGNDKCSM